MCHVNVLKRYNGRDVTTPYPSRQTQKMEGFFKHDTEVPVAISSTYDFHVKVYDSFCASWKYGRNSDVTGEP